MSLAVTVITASLPHRADMLREAVASVQAQTIPHVTHHVLVNAGISVAEARNRMLQDATTDWVAFLDDDDLLDPNHLEVLTARAESGDVDIVIPHCRFEGPPLPEGYYNTPYDRETLRAHGAFPITLLARRETLASVGNFNPRDTWEDWAMFNRAADIGARFEVVPTVTWTYRRGHDDSRTNQIAEGRAPERRRRARRSIGETP